MCVFLGVYEMKKMTCHGITVTERDDGTYLVSGRIDGEKWSEVHKSFQSAGESAFDMADNNDFGRDINHKMCRVFGKVFF